MDLQEFARQHFDKVTGTNSENMGQCVGLVQKFLQLNGVPFFFGNAKDLLANAPGQYLEKIVNDHGNPNQFPQPGDILVFNGAWGGGLGHTGICTKANAAGFTMFEQNNPEGSRPRFLDHPAVHYNTVTGWLRLKKAAPAPQEDRYMGKTAQEWAKDADYATGVANERSRLLAERTQERDFNYGVAEQRDGFVKQVAAALGHEYASINQAEVSEMVGEITRLRTQPPSASSNPLLSRKLWLTVSSLIALAVNGQWPEFMAVLAAYLGIQGYVDSKK